MSKKITIIITLLIQWAFFANSQFQTNTNSKGSDYYLNPIFAGDYAGPSILRDGDTYHIVNSSFEYYPGLLIWKSKDLIDWTPVTHALDKYVGSVWAPDLVKYNNKYYIYFPANNEICVSVCSPLLCIPSDHSYIAQVEIFIEGEATGGLVLFYNNSAHSGILVDKGNILADLGGWQFITEKGVIKEHVFLRIKDINNTVDMYYSNDGKNWNKIDNSAEVSGYNHNVLGEFLDVRLGLCSMG